MFNKSVILIAAFFSAQAFGIDYNETKQKVDALSGDYKLVKAVSDSSCVQGVVSFEMHNVSYKSQENRRFDEIGFRIYNRETTDFVTDISDINEGNVFHRNENPMCNKPFPCYDRWQYLKSAMDDKKIVSVHGYAKSTFLLNRPQPAFEGIYKETTIKYSELGFSFVQQIKDAKGLENPKKLTCIYSKI